jgi:hypothetical protein
MTVMFLPLRGRKPWFARELRPGQGPRAVFQCLVRVGWGLLMKSGALLTVVWAGGLPGVESGVEGVELGRVEDLSGCDAA